VNHVLVLGGTSDATPICQQLEMAAVPYTLSVATEAGARLASVREGSVLCGRQDAGQLAELLASRRVNWLVDATHPYAQEISRNAWLACQQTGIAYSRYRRPSQLDCVSHPLLHKVANIEQACGVAGALGPRVLLTTGSKDLARWQAGLPGKHLLVRVLPVASVIEQCEQLGLGPENIFALKGPFDAAFNQALYQFCAPDVVITKESGIQGGYLDKIVPALQAAIPCIVVTRPREMVPEALVLDGPEAFTRKLQGWLASPVNPQPSALSNRRTTV
jgi:precorrin-6A/cobalt-precorrin-6A reductase